MIRAFLLAAVLALTASCTNSSDDNQIATFEHYYYGQQGDHYQYLGEDNQLTNVQYLGRRGNELQLMISDPMHRQIIRCTAPCSQADVLILTNDESMKKVLGDKVVQKTSYVLEGDMLLAYMVNDAMAGNLVPAGNYWYGDVAAEKNDQKVIDWR